MNTTTPLQEKIRKHIHLDLEQNILEKNNMVAATNRLFFKERKIITFNMVSSPGAGKTALLECTLNEGIDILQDLHSRFYVIEGDQQTTRDAERIMNTGVPVIQINTGKGCHLDAQMISDALVELNPTEEALLFIENVGNLVCPAMFDLGEWKRIVVASVTEGEDKPLKYPYMFAGSHLCVISKIDLLPYLSFDLAEFKDNALQTNQQLEFLEVSCTRGEGLDRWYHWLREQIKQQAIVEEYTHPY